MDRTRTTVQDRWLSEYLDLEDDFEYRREREQHRREAVSAGSRRAVDDDNGDDVGHEGHAAESGLLSSARHSRTMQKRDTRGGETMTCPRCGDLLLQIAVEKVKAERCSSCSGVYFDCDDIDFLLHAHEAEHILDLFRTLLTRTQPRREFRPSHLEL